MFVMLWRLDLRITLWNLSDLIFYLSKLLIDNFLSKKFN